MRNKFLLACLVLSGFAGLAYELLWVRLLALGFGSTTLSFSTVLAVFFGGLALGAWLAGRKASQIRYPIRVYAWLEIGTGVLGLVLYPLLVRLGDVFAAIDPGPGLPGVLARAAISAPLLLGPTLLMGATLPVVMRAMVVEDKEVGSGTALIYAFNTFGAFFGTYLVTYLLLPELGVFKSTLLTVVINFVVGGISLALGRNYQASTEEPTEAPKADEEETIEDKVRIVATTLAFLTGLAAICFQVVWVRLVSIFLDGTIYGVGSVLICVLIGIGLGSFLVSNVLKKTQDPGLWFGGLQIVTLVSVILLANNFSWAAYGLRTIVEDSKGIGAIHKQLGLVLALLIVPSLASGASFPLLMQIIERKVAGAGRSLARLYSWNTLGSILGSLLTGFVLIPAAGTVATLYAGLALVGLVGAVGFALLSKQSSVIRLAAAAAPLALVANFQGFDAQILSQAGRNSAKGKSHMGFTKFLEGRNKDTTYFAEGSAATVIILSDEERGSLLLNGLGQGSRQSLPPHHVFESLMVALVPQAYVKAPEKALVVGLGAGSTVDALLQFGLKKLVVLELESEVVNGLKYIYPEKSPLDDPRVELHINDARHELLVDAQRNPKSYDLITSMPAHPWVASSIFTKEFFELARENLSDKGVFSTWFGLSRMDKKATASLLRAFTQSFPYYIVHNIQDAGALYVVGSNSPLKVDVEYFKKLRALPFVKTQPNLDTSLYLAKNIIGSGGPGDKAMSEGPVNTDDSAYVEVNAPRTSSATRQIDEILPQPYLKADFLYPESQRAELAEALLEELLGTPEGKIPTKTRPIVPRLVQRQLNEFTSVLNSDQANYFKGRLLAIKGKKDEAEKLWQSISEPRLKDKVALFSALAQPKRSAARAEAIVKLPQRGDTWFLQIKEGLSGLKGRLPETAPNYEQDRLGWYIWQVFTDTSTQGSAQDRYRMGKLAKQVITSQNTSLLKLSQRYATRKGWKYEASAFDRALVKSQKQRAKQLHRRGWNAGKASKFKEAARLLQQAYDLGSQDNKTIRLLAAALVHANDVQGLEVLKQRLVFRDWPAERINELIRQAQVAKMRGRQHFESATMQ